MKNTKTIVLACIIVVCSIVSISLLAPSMTEAGDPILTDVKIFKSHGSLSVTGTASIDSKPDLMTITLRMKAEDPNSVEKATEQVAAMIDKLLDSLQELGISKDDVETISYTINQKYRSEYDKKGNYIRSVFDGYVVVNTIKIKLKDFDKSGKVIDAISNASGLVDYINFELSSEKRNELKRQVMAKAAEDARLKAEAVIISLGEELGNVTSVNLNEYYYQPYVYWNRYTLGISENEPNDIVPTTILPSDLTVSSDVYVVFDMI